MMRYIRRFCKLIFLLLILFMMMCLPASASNFWDLDTTDTQNEMDGIPGYWIEELKQGTKDINIALMEAGSRKAAFLFYTDSHWDHNSQHSPALLKYLYEHTGMAKTIFGGDIVHAEAPDYDTMAYLWEWRSQVKALPNHHSVPGNHDDGNSKDYKFDEDFVYAYLLAPEETPDIVREDHGLYYYIDVPAEKTRYLYLDTGAKAIMYDPTQAQFLIDSLMSTPDGWHIVVVAHVWYNVDYDNPDEPIHTLTDPGELILSTLDAYNRRDSSVVRVCKSSTDYSTLKLPYDFSNCGATVEFCIGGHIHRDFDTTSEDGIPVIMVESDSYITRSNLSTKEGTINENSINGIIADYDARKVTIVRIGRGESRVVPLR